jgi:hypothetical protein
MKNVKLKKTELVNMIKGGDIPDLMELQKNEDLGEKIHIESNGWGITGIKWKEDELLKLTEEELYNLYKKINNSYDGIGVKARRNPMHILNLKKPE